MNIDDIVRGRHFFYIGGPCAIENMDSALKHAEAIKKVCTELHVPFIFKSSYDKANRLSISSFRGVGLDEGLKILGKVKKEFGTPVLTDIHAVTEVKPVSEIIDVIQIPAFLCRQTDLITAISETGRPVNIKKGQFLSPWDMKHIAEKAASTGNKKIILTERGSSFGYGYLINDMRAIPIMKGFGYPVMIDAGHSVQLPGMGAGKSSGMREMIPTIAKSGVAAGADGLYLETHFNPDKAPSDGSNMLPIDQLKGLLKTLLEIYEICH